MSGFDVGTWLEVEGLVKRQSGKIAAGSNLDVRKQAELYLEACGGEATKRQVGLRVEELDGRRRKLQVSGGQDGTT